MGRRGGAGEQEIERTSVNDDGVPRGPGASLELGDKGESTYGMRADVSTFLECPRPSLSLAKTLVAPSARGCHFFVFIAAPFVRRVRERTIARCAGAPRPS